MNKLLVVSAVFILTACDSSIGPSNVTSKGPPGSSPDNPIDEQPPELTFKVRQSIYLRGVDTQRAADFDRYAAYMIFVMTVGKQDIPCMVITYGSSFAYVGALIDAKKENLSLIRNMRIIKAVEIDLLTGIRTTSNEDLLADQSNLTKMRDNKTIGVT